MLDGLHYCHGLDLTQHRPIRHGPHAWLEAGVKSDASFAKSCLMVKPNRVESNIPIANVRLQRLEAVIQSAAVAHQGSKFAFAAG
ncbi:hypothetical protein KUD11_14710 [Roseovarius sp. LXJ103]|uniref:hypothetical protein n=1 Tax=Roseovarius carneus TaxID=2853164 RepID=UPI000D60AF5E|nr:hypothetical protein [Roseovarius carneus]MBZ8119890.1 hypothetical protein [Roseovarius carneus]PWE34522.1 hypothetical protein DD563_00030 [Pelagicola sp. LXJ1103]